MMERGIRLQTGVGGLSDSWEIHARVSVAARMSDNRHLRFILSSTFKRLRVYSIYCMLDYYSTDVSAHCLPVELHVRERHNVVGMRPRYRLVFIRSYGGIVISANESSDGRVISSGNTVHSSRYSTS
jgi:hypothetical protein